MYQTTKPNLNEESLSFKASLFVVVAEVVLKGGRSLVRGSLAQKCEGKGFRKVLRRRLVSLQGAISSSFALFPHSLSDKPTSANAAHLVTTPTAATPTPTAFGEWASSFQHCDPWHLLLFALLLQCPADWCLWPPRSSFWCVWMLVWAAC